MISISTVIADASMKAKKKKLTYEVLTTSEMQWVKCVKAAPQPSGWLNFELRDGTVGLARPDHWRIKSYN